MTQTQREPTPSRNSASPTPVHRLHVLRQAGIELERGTNTTTNFENISTEEIAMVAEGNETDGFDLETCYDADDRRSIDVICDCCRGIGHVRRQCPSPKQYRSFSYAIRLLELSKSRAEQRAKLSNNPVGERRPPPRGQRQPFRNQPNRFQPLPARAKCVSGISADSDGSLSDGELQEVTEHVTQTAIARGGVQSMPVSLGDFFKDELSTAHSIQLRCGLE